MLSLYPYSEKFTQRLQALLHSSRSDEHLLETVAELAAEDGNSVYAEMLKLITGKYLEQDLAKSYWDAAISHRGKIFRPKYVARGFRAAASYARCGSIAAAAGTPHRDA